MIIDEKITENDNKLRQRIFENAEVNRLYLKYKKACDEHFARPVEDSGGERAYYVYAWHTKTNPKKYFYVGKGTKNRWKHIEKEIDNATPNGIYSLIMNRSKQYAYLKEHYGINCEILLDGLTESEAYVYEQCKKIEMTEQGEILLDGEGDVSDLSWLNKDPGPRLSPNPFVSRYMSLDSPNFDVVTAEGLKKIWFYPSSLSHTAESLEKERKVANYVISKGGKVQGRGANFNSVIISGQGSNAYYKYKIDEGKLLYSIDDVINYIDHDSGYSDDGSDPRVNDGTKLFHEKKKQMTKYIKELLIKAGADKDAIIEEECFGEIHLQILGHGFVSFLPYKKKPGGVVTVPLDDSEEVKPFLTRLNSWKGDFVFNELDELEILMPFFRKQVERPQFRQFGS